MSSAELAHTASGARGGRVGEHRRNGTLARGVPEIQRARILGALVEVARERGAGRVTVAHVVARSGVSRRTFYELFEDRDACFVAAFDDAVERAAARVLPAFEGTADWRGGIRAALEALLGFLDDEPALGGLCVVDALGAGSAVLERRGEVLAVLVDAVDRGRSRAKAGARPTRLTAEGVVGGVLSVLYARLVESRASVESPESLARLRGPLMAMLVLPYLGARAAAQEAARPAPRSRRRAAFPPSNPLEGLPMRLTYRTVRVLAVIAAEPGASNREIAAAAGIHDQGQISKLLGRLEHLGLIVNTGVGQARGEPNAWHLTGKGGEVERAIRQPTTPA